MSAADDDARRERAEMVAGVAAAADYSYLVPAPDASPDVLSGWPTVHVETAAGELSFPVDPRYVDLVLDAGVPSVEPDAGLLI